MSLVSRLACSCIRIGVLVSLLSVTSHALDTPRISVSPEDLEAADALIDATAGFVESGQILVAPGADGDPALVMAAFPRRAEEVRRHLARIDELSGRDDWSSQSQVYSEAFELLRTAYLLRGSIDRVSGAQGYCKGAPGDLSNLCPVVNPEAEAVLRERLKPVVAVARRVAQSCPVLDVPDEQLSVSGALRRATALFELSVHGRSPVSPPSLDLSADAIESLRARFYDLELRESHMRFAVELDEPLRELIGAVRVQAGLDEMTRAQILVPLEFAQAQIRFWMEWSQCWDDGQRAPESGYVA